MELKIRPVEGKGWYEYKMAVVGTLLDHGMYMRIKRKGTKVIVIYRKDAKWMQGEGVVYKQLMHLNWRDFYNEELPKVLKAYEEMTSCNS